MDDPYRALHASSSAKPCGGGRMPGRFDDFYFIFLIELAVVHRKGVQRGGVSVQLLSGRRAARPAPCVARLRTFLRPCASVPRRTAPSTGRVPSRQFLAGYRLWVPFLPQSIQPKFLRPALDLVSLHRDGMTTVRNYLLLSIKRKAILHLVDFGHGLPGCPGWVCYPCAQREPCFQFHAPFINSIVSAHIQSSPRPDLLPGAKLFTVLDT